MDGHQTTRPNLASSVGIAADTARAMAPSRDGMGSAQQRPQFLGLCRKKILDMWYGNSSDHGSPGIRDGGATPRSALPFPSSTARKLARLSFSGRPSPRQDNAGFNILRGQTRTGEFKVINTQMIPGAGTTAERNTYTWTDTTAKPNVRLLLSN